MSERALERGSDWENNSLPGHCVAPQVEVFAQLASSWDRRNPECLPNSLEQLVLLDPALAGAMLSEASVVSSRRIWSIGQAMTILSPSKIACILLSGADDVEFTSSISRRSIWKHCISVALAAELLAERAGLCNSEKAYIAGLFCDVGRLELVDRYPKAFTQAQATAHGYGLVASTAEQRIIGVNHLSIGRNLCRSWYLPEAVCDCAYLHELQVDRLPKSIVSPELVFTVCLAERIVALIAKDGFSCITASGDIGSLARKWALPLELIQSIVDEVPALLHKKLTAANLEGHLAGGLGAAGYQGAIAKANRILARIASKMIDEKEEKMPYIKSQQCLDIICCRLSGSTSLGDVLRTCATVIRQQAGSPWAEVHWLEPAGTDIIAARCDDRSTQLKRFPKPWRENQTWADSNDWLGLPNSLRVAMFTDGMQSGDISLPAQTDPKNKEWLEVLAKTLSVFLSTTALRATAENVASELAATIAEVGAATVEIDAAAKTEAAIKSSETTDAFEATDTPNVADDFIPIPHADTIAIVADLAAGAAHELNTPLAVISGRAQLMKESADSEADRNAWNQIAEQSHVISDVISELMEFASPPNPTPTVCDTEKCFKDAQNEVSSSSSTSTRAIRFVVNVLTNTPPIWSDWNQTQTILRELIKNAVSAMDGEGQLRLQAQVSDDGTQVILQVSDDGTGMDQATLSKAFTPFFSRQQAGRGRGMGLARARRYVENNAGDIQIASTPGEGTTVTVRLPAVSRNRG